MDITKEISDAIAKNLPQAVGNELQAVLAQAAKDAAAVVKLTGELAERSSALAKAQATITEKVEIINKHAALELRETAVLTRERDIDIRELCQELAAEKRISAHGLEITSRLVRNLEYRSNVMSATNIPVVVPTPGGYSTTQVHQHQQTDNKTSTAE